MKKQPKEGSVVTAGEDASKSGGSEVMTPDHPGWEEFADTLAYWKYLGQPETSRQMKCDHSFVHTRVVLTGMGGFDIETTLVTFQANGAHCDCEVLLNVDPGPQNDDDEGVSSGEL